MTLLSRTTIVLCLALLSRSTICAAAGTEESGALALPETLIPLCSPAGLQMFEQSIGKQTGMRMLMYFETQPSLSTCAPTSLAVGLNALGSPRPVSKVHKPFRLYTAAS